MRQIKKSATPGCRPRNLLQTGLDLISDTSSHHSRRAQAHYRGQQIPQAHYRGQETPPFSWNWFMLGVGIIASVLYSIYIGFMSFLDYVTPIALYAVSYVMRTNQTNGENPPQTRGYNSNSNQPNYNRHRWYENQQNK